MPNPYLVFHPSSLWFGSQSHHTRPQPPIFTAANVDYFHNKHINPSLNMATAAKILEEKTILNVARLTSAKLKKTPSEQRHQLQ
jgi:hypothetical protein